MKGEASKTCRLNRVCSHYILQVLFLNPFGLGRGDNRKAGWTDRVGLAHEKRKYQYLSVKRAVERSLPLHPHTPLSPGPLTMCLFQLSNFNYL